MSDNYITVQSEVQVPLEKAWDLWTSPEHIVHWNHASEEWSCPRAESDLKVGGRYTFRMEAKDGSMGFDMCGTFLKIEYPHFLSYDMDDGRLIEVSFEAAENGTRIIERFQPEQIHSIAMQQEGWQAIINNFKSYAEKHEA